MKILISSIICFSFFLTNRSLYSNAQVIPDNTIPIRSSVNRKNNNINILGGTKKKNNLFHSFKQFSVKSNETVNFKQNDGIDYVFTRITSPSRSSIDGAINITGKAELVFINPSGITFGKNSRIFSNRPVTFSTANRIRFNDVVFDASEKFTNLERLSKFSTFDLIFDMPQSIEFTGNGFTNILKSPETVPFTSILTNSILNPQRFSFAPKTVLAGNSINLNGALLNSNGKLKLVSIKRGSITYNSSKHNLVDEKLADINLSNRSQIESVGTPFKGIELTARNITLKNSSSIIGSNLGGNATQNIEIDAERLTLSGITDLNSSGVISLVPEFLFTNTFDSSIRAQNIKGNGIGVSINSKDIFLERFSSIAIVNESFGFSGDLNIDASNITIDGQPPLPLLPTAISIQNIQGNIGDLNIKSKNLNIFNGGFVASTILSGSAQGPKIGNINLEIDNINVTGETLLDPSRLPVSSSISTSTEQSGSSGNINIESNSIKLSDHGNISTNSVGFSSSGDININTRNLSINGIGETGTNQTGIFARSVLTDVFFDPNQLFLGESGEINIKSRNTSISDSAQIAVSNLGIGDAGSIFLNSEVLDLKNNGSIVATTNGGDGGKIEISANKIDLYNSRITSSARKFGTGGGIEIESDLLAAKGLNTIEANADNNFGGNISIRANTTILSRGTSITATSNRGPTFDGSIEANIQNTQPIKTIKLSPIRQPNVEVSQICGFDGNRLSVTSKADFEAIVGNPDLITAWGIQQRYLTHEGKYFRDIKTGEVKPMRPVLALEYMENGEIRSIYKPEDSEYVLNLISSLERKCSELHST